MDVSFGFVGRGYTLVVTDTSASRSFMRIKGDVDKTKKLGPHMLMAYSGEPGDTTHFAEYIERNLRLNHIRHHHELRPAAAASWIRRELAQAIRSRHPYAVFLLLGGFDTSTAAKQESDPAVGGIPKLYWMDYLGTKAEVPFAAHGYGMYFLFSLLDRYHNPDASLEEGLELAKKCIAELQKRLVTTVDGFRVSIVDKDGVREVNL